MQDRKMQDWKMVDESGGLENARLENDGLENGDPTDSIDILRYHSRLAVISAPRSTRCQSVERTAL